MKCAQCEKAEATLLCVDEDLDFCESCSVLLHKKKARMHHEVVPRKAALVCDECEDAEAEVECFQCGGRRTALVFCRSCSDSLHSRVARTGHHVALISMLKVQGIETCVGGRVVIDLTNLDSDEGNQNNTPQQKKDTVDTGSSTVASKVVCVKQEAARAADSKSRVPETIYTNDRNTPDIITKKSRNQKSSNMNNLPSAKLEGMQGVIASLIRLGDDDAMCKENIPGKGQRRRTLPKTLSAKKEPRESKGESSGSSGSDRHESDDELSGVHRIKRGSVLLEAFVVDVDDEDDGPSGDVPRDKVESGIRKRIRNMLELGLHPDTPEFEAQQALKNAQRLLTKHNLQQAEVLKGTLADTSSLVGGMRVVELRAKGKLKRGRMDAWVQELGWVIADNFDCQYFFKAGTSSKPFRVVFYGISQNADCAGYAFAGTYNRISTMAAAYIACKPLDDDDKENQEVWKQYDQINRGTYTRVARTNYRKGVVAGLKEAVKNAQKTRKEYDVLSDEMIETPTGERCGDDNDESPSHEIEGEDSCFSSGSLKSTRQGKNHNDDSTSTTTTRVAERCMAITALVLHSQNVGDEYLKQKGIKIRRRTTKSRSAVWNEEAFRQGKTDAATIDINQKSITDAKVKKNKSRGSAK